MTKWLSSFPHCTYSVAFSRFLCRRVYTKLYKSHLPQLTIANYHFRMVNNRWFDNVVINSTSLLHLRIKEASEDYSVHYLILLVDLFLTSFKECWIQCCFNQYGAAGFVSLCHAIRMAADSNLVPNTVSIFLILVLYNTTQTILSSMSHYGICTWTTYIIWATAWQNLQNGMWAQRRFRSAWASAQSDQSLRCPHEKEIESLATHWVHSEDTD